MISHVTLKNFKKVKKFDSDLDKINILVGANNSGKSSVLQGIQFTIMAEVAKKYLNRNSTVPQEKLFYSPSADFTVLRHGSPYTNYSGNTSELILVDDSENKESFSITLNKGRNYGNISISVNGYNKFRQTVTSFNNLYSTYTPGLSGVSLKEKIVGKAVLRNAAANGDANLYLRNIIYYVAQEGKLQELNNLIKQVFVNTQLNVDFNPDNDIDILVEVNSSGHVIPIELCGTGLLQAIQIMAYSIYFKPKLLLLDEPDEHLHPNNQLLLCNALKLLSDEYDLQIILSTHSRHMIAAMEGFAKYIWMKNGAICEEKIEPSYYNLLFDLGALDTFDDVIKGKYRNVVLTEDTNISYMETLLKANKIDLSKVLIYSYKTSGQIDSAILVGCFIKKSSLNCNVIIHRDRDFMTDEEVSIVTNKIIDNDLTPWITVFSDIEAYFTTPQHLANITGKEQFEIMSWINKLLKDNHVEIQTDFVHKRDEIKQKFYRDGKLKGKDSIAFPDTVALLGKDVPTNTKNVKGKFLLKKLNGDRINFLGKEVKLDVESNALEDKTIQDIFM